MGGSRSSRTIASSLVVAIIVLASLWCYSDDFAAISKNCSDSSRDKDEPTFASAVTASDLSEEGASLRSEIRTVAATIVGASSASQQKIETKIGGIEGHLGAIAARLDSLETDGPPPTTTTTTSGGRPATTDAAPKTPETDPRPTKGAAASTTTTRSGVALPDEVCRRLNSRTLHARHEPTPELRRLDGAYALNRDVLRTGFVRGRLKPELLGRIGRSEPVAVLTLGGSFTRGHGCGETVFQDERECAWPARFGRWFDAYLNPDPGGGGGGGGGTTTNEFVNAAEHGASSVNALQRIGVIVQSMSREPDLVILDFLVNDSAFGAEEVATAGYEKLIRLVQELLPRAQLLLVEAGCRGCIANERVLQRRRRIARHYDIPAIDYAAMVQLHNIANGGAAVLWPTEDPPLNEATFVIINNLWPNFLPPVNTTKPTCCPNNHPPFPVHQYFSDSIAFGLVQMLREEGCQQETGDDDERLPRPYLPKSQLQKYPSCTKPLVSHDAFDDPAARGESESESSSSAELAPRGQWRLYEDKPGRPGWIATEVGRRHTFPVRLGSQPAVAVTYLRSYAHVGSAEVKFTSHNGTTSSVRLDARWDRNYSLPHTAFFIERPDGVDGNLLAALQSDGYDVWNSGWKQGHSDEGKPYNIDVTLVEGEKFKITQIISC